MKHPPALQIDETTTKTEGRQRLTMKPGDRIYYQTGQRQRWRAGTVTEVNCEFVKVLKVNRRSWLPKAEAREAMPVTVRKARPRKAGPRHKFEFEI